jgi:hypothetical protein
MTTPSEYDGGVAYDPSDEAEVDRISARNPNLGGDNLSGFEQGILSEVVGIGPEFFDIPN